MNLQLSHVEVLYQLLKKNFMVASKVGKTQVALLWELEKAGYVSYDEAVVEGVKVKSYTATPATRVVFVEHYKTSNFLQAVEKHLELMKTPPVVTA